MILLDTNVLSEFMRPGPSASVVSWLDEQPAAEVYTSAISRAEIELGLLLMPSGKRQEALSQAALAMFDEDFAGRCLPFDQDAARQYAAIVSARTRAGRPISVEDAQIAAIALTHRMPFAIKRRCPGFVHALTSCPPW